jgi:hypothetical protein
MQLYLITDNYDFITYFTINSKIMLKVSIKVFEEARVKIIWPVLIICGWGLHSVYGC